MRGSFSPFLFLFVCKKGTFYLSVNVFSTKVLNGDTIFLRLLMETGPPFYVVIRAKERSRRYFVTYILERLKIIWVVPRSRIMVLKPNGHLINGNFILLNCPCFLCGQFNMLKTLTECLFSE